MHWSVITGIVDNAGGNGKTPTTTEQVQELIDLIPEFVDEENDGPARMKKLLSGDKPVAIGQVNALYEWLLEVSSGRPTEQPSPSQTGRGRTGAT